MWLDAFGVQHRSCVGEDLLDADYNSIITRLAERFDHTMFGTTLPRQVAVNICNMIIADETADALHTIDIELEESVDSSSPRRYTAVIFARDPESIKAKKHVLLASKKVACFEHRHVAFRDLMQKVREASALRFGDREDLTKTVRQIEQQRASLRKRRESLTRQIKITRLDWSDRVNELWASIDERKVQVAREDASLACRITHSRPTSRDSRGRPEEPATDHLMKAIDANIDKRVEVCNLWDKDRILGAKRTDVQSELETLDRILQVYCKRREAYLHRRAKKTAYRAKSQLASPSTAVT